MKKLILIAILGITVIACDTEQPPKDYAVIHGTIKNPTENLDLRLYNPTDNNTAMVKVDEEGNFRDTLRLDTPATFNAVYGTIFSLHLENNMDVTINFDTKDFSNSLAFSGEGEVKNNFLKYKTNKTTELFGDNYKDYLSLNEADFNAKTDAYLADLNAEMDNKISKIDSTFRSSQIANMDEFKKSIMAQNKEQLVINAKLGEGKPSPEFNEYTNYAGGTSSLKDFRGSYVYIDVWATWCIPCIVEIPFLQEVEKEYHDKNIKFVSLSIDNAEDEPKWRKMIEDKKLDGVQLLADKDYDSQFIRDYFIYGIPRFILIDPQGNVVNYDAPRPSEERLKTLFNTLDI